MFIMNLFNVILGCGFNSYFLLNSKRYFVFSWLKGVNVIVGLVEMFVFDF